MHKIDGDFWQQILSFLAFVAAVATIFFACIVLLCQRVIERVQRKPPRAVSARDKCIFLLGGIGIICVLYGYFVEPYWLAVETVNITSPKIHTGTRPIRIVQISDLHCDPKPRLEEKLPDVIAALKPDIIAFTGDSINSPQGLPIFRKCLTQVAKIAPTFVVKGNWDAWYFTDLDRFANTGAKELDGEPIPVTVDGNKIWLTGLPVETKKTITDAVRNIPINDYRVFLFHYPDFIDESAENRVDLYLAGHTHGGQVALPFYGAIITLAASGKRYERGLYHRGSTYLYVNRGIGMEGGKAPRVRFCARPEVTVFNISGEDVKTVPEKQ